MKKLGVSKNKMGTQKMFPLIVSMALPAMFSMLVQALYNIVDSYFVAQYSTDALSAVSLAFPIQNLIIAFAVGTAVGTGAFVSRKLGEGDRRSADLAASNGLVLSVLTFIIFLLIGLFLIEPFYRLYEDNETIINMGVQYLTIISCFSVFSFIQISFEKILQSTGNMFWPMIMQTAGAVINIILDPILIFGMFGLPAMGVAGAAIATIIGQTCACLIAVWALLNKNHVHEVAIHLKGFRFDKNIVRSIYIVGFPTIVMNAIGTIMLMAMNAILAAFSTAAYTVFGIYYKLQSFVFMPVFGLSSGLLPILGYNYGAKNKHRIVSCLKIGACISLGINFLGTLTFWLIPSQLLSIFEATQEIYDIGVPALKIISTGYVFAAVGITLSTLFQATGKGTYSLINSALRQLVVLVPMALILSRISLSAVWFAFPTADFVSVIVALLCLKKLYNEKLKDL